MGTVIIGGGIIGIATAYYLSEVLDDPSSVHVVESSSRLFASASGYAAGFLAKDWFSPTTAELGALSFHLHQKLAEEHNGDERWGYASSIALSLAVQEGIGVGIGERGEDWLLHGTSRAEVSGRHDLINEDGSPTWLTRQEGGSLSVISSKGGCAQVDPLRLCAFLLEACLARGVQLHHPAQVTSLDKDEEGRITGVNLMSDGRNVPGEVACENVVLASGAWTPAVYKTLFPASAISIPISPLAGYSLVIRSPRHSLLDEQRYGRSHAIFSAPTKTYSWAPEIFSRKGGELYLAGLNDTALHLPEHATEATIAGGPLAEIKKVAAQLIGSPPRGPDELSGGDLEVIREGLCFRPVCKRGTPVIAKVLDEKLGKGTSCAQDGGVFIAAGHGPWGISLSLGTGKVVAEMLQGESTSADISCLGL